MEAGPETLLLGGKIEDRMRADRQNTSHTFWTVAVSMEMVPRKDHWVITCLSHIAAPIWTGGCIPLSSTIKSIVF